MGFRFRRSISLGKGVRLNLSKRGVGVSAGVKGARVGIGPRGLYASAGIPGTGLYATGYAGSKSRTRSKKVVKESLEADGSPPLTEFPSAGELGLSTPHTGLFWLGAVVAVAIIPFPPGVLIAIALLLVWYLRKRSKNVQLGQCYQKARSLIVAKEYREAAELIAQLVKELPSPRALLALGHTRMLAQEHEPAAAAYAEYLAVNPADVEVAIRYASLAMRQGKFQEALATLERLPEEVRQDIRVLGMMGTCLLGTGQAELAIEVLKKAPLRVRKPDRALTSIRYTLGLAYQETGDKKRALTMFNRVYADDSDYLDVRGRIEALQKKK